MQVLLFEMWLWVHNPMTNRKRCSIQFGSRYGWCNVCVHSTTGSLKRSPSFKKGKRDWFHDSSWLKIAYTVRKRTYFTDRQAPTYLWMFQDRIGPKIFTQFGPWLVDPYSLAFEAGLGDLLDLCFPSICFGSLASNVQEIKGEISGRVSTRRECWLNAELANQSCNYFTSNYTCIFK